MNQESDRSWVKHELAQRLLDHLASLGFGSAESIDALESLLFAERRNKETHGLNRIFSGFVRRLIDDNLCEPMKSARVSYAKDGYFLVDGARTFGYATIKRLLREVLAPQMDRDLLFLQVTNLYPTNCLAEYAEFFCDRGFACYVTSRSPARATAPLDQSRGLVALRAAVGTNAHAWGFPDPAGPHVIFDATMAAATHGDFLKPLSVIERTFSPSSFRTKDLRVPKSARDLLDAKGRFEGFILPLGGDRAYKAFGNLLTAELFDFFQKNELPGSTTIAAFRVPQLSDYGERLSAFRQQVCDSLRYEDGSGARLPNNSGRPVRTIEEVLHARAEEIHGLTRSPAAGAFVPSLSGQARSRNDRMVAKSSPGARLLALLQEQHTVLALGAATPSRVLLLRELDVPVAWVSRLELSALLGESEAKSIDVETVNFFLSRIHAACPEVSLVVDCDAAWFDEPQRMACAFSRWSSRVAAVCIENRTPRDMSRTILEDPSRLARRLKLIAELSKDMLVCLRLENLIAGQSVAESLDYLAAVKEAGGRFELVIPSVDRAEPTQLKLFADLFRKRFGADVTLMSIFPASQSPDLFRSLGEWGYRLVAIPDVAARQEYRALKDCYRRLAAGDFAETDRTLASAVDILEDLPRSRPRANLASQELKDCLVQQVRDDLRTQMESLRRTTQAPLPEQKPGTGNSFFEEWGKSDYDLVNLPDHGLLMEALRAELEFDERDLVLDIGCGTGEALRMIRAASRVVCVDLAESMLAKLRSRQSQFPFELQTVCADFLSYRSDMRFTKAFAIMSLHHVDHGDKPAAMAHLASLLAPGGRIFVGETFFDTLDTDSPDRILAISELYSRKVRNCVENRCFAHATRDVTILERILNRNGEYMVTLSAWRRLLEDAGLRVVRWAITSPHVSYGYIVAEKPAQQLDALARP